MNTRVSTKVSTSVSTSRAVNECEAPPVWLEPCVAFAAHDAEDGICGACGWLEVEHVLDLDVAAEAVRAA